MIISWRRKRQLVYFFIFALVTAFIVWRIIVALLPEPTCFDGKQNQNEKGVDCGGVCSKVCVGVVQDVSILWTQLLEINPGSYDAAALIENPNLFAGTETLTYRFKLYDENNVLVAVRQRETFVNAGERFVIFEPNIPTFNRVPHRVILEIAELQDVEWKRIEKEKPKLLITRKEFINAVVPSLRVQIRNDGVLPIQYIDVVGILYDENQNVEAVSSTRIDSIAGESQRQAIFTWPRVFEREPAVIDVFLRVNQTTGVD